MKKNSDIEFKCADLTKENVNVDVLLVIDVIEHLQDYFSFLKSISKKKQVHHIPHSFRYVRVEFVSRTNVDRKQRTSRAYS
ncbi:MAG: hypothetical protein IPG08_14275 [Sphingobacteriaceae bacterium]|nr:hypothetical protein [Sphingobacteriaceae bacterium]